MQKLLLLILFVMPLSACQPSRPATPASTLPVATPNAPVATVAPAATNEAIATTGPLAVTPDGIADNGEWDGVNKTGAQGGVIGSIRYGFGDETLFIRLDARNSWADLGDGTIGVYIGAPRTAATLVTTQAGSPLGFRACYLGELFFDSTGVSSAELKDVSDEDWSDEGTQFQVAQQGKIIEMAIPFKLLGKPQAGDVLKLRVAVNNGAGDTQFVPPQQSLDAPIP